MRRYLRFSRREPYVPSGAFRLGLDRLRLSAALTLFFFLHSTLSPAVAAAAAATSDRPTSAHQPTTPSPTDPSSLPLPNSNPTDSSVAAEKSPSATASPSPPTTSSAAAAQSAATNARQDPAKTAPTTGSAPTSAGEATTIAEAAPASSPFALPTGADKSGVTSKAISLPQGSGKIQGMGESFSAQLSTGIATFSVPFALPKARGGAQPSLGLSYSSSGGFGEAGVGWNVGVPFVARQTDRGVPSYVDGASFDANQDRFVFNGGQELVPICVVSAGGTCSGAIANEAMPAWAVGSMYFRPRVEGSYLRFFFAPDHRTWRVQDKSGVTMELGVPLNDFSDTSALETNPNDATEIYRWHLVRQYDTYGAANPSGALVAPAPNNVVVYRYIKDGGSVYLSDIFDTSPASAPTTTDLSSFAHHTHLSYEQRSDPTVSYRAGFALEQNLRLVGVDVASKVYAGALNAPRHQVRRYHLSYEASHASLLSSVEVEGRCTGAEATAPAEDGQQLLPPATNCPTLPPMTFGYTHVAGSADLPGYEAFNEELHSPSASPPNSVDEELTDLFDVNSDGLPDVLVTDPATYSNGHGVFFNALGGTPDSFGAAQVMGVQGVLGANATTLTFRNLNLAPLDLDGDGTIDLLHMPAVKTYAVYAPTLVGSSWKWVGRAVSTASGQNPKIDFGKDTLNTKVLDVNGDGLVDVLVSTGTEYQTFLSLGRYPQGDGQFGNGGWRSATLGQISNEPIRTCVPWAATPVQLSDPDVQLADMNGDGLPDIVRVRRGDIRYWPGRGNGFWGTGSRSDCKAGTFESESRVIAMDTSPFYSDIQGTTLRMDDVNGDGLDDLVQVRFDAIDIWLNIDGRGWTKRHIISGTPASPSYASRVRLTDVNGSGTRDILWGNGRKYQYIDVQGGVRPWLLNHVENGLGKSTDIEYGTSTDEMLAAERSGKACDPANPWSSAWCSKMPTVAHVVKRVTDSDNLGSNPGKYVTEYQYRDPVFEGRQREFRGFSRARSHQLGDANSPGSYTESAFLLGECEDETPNDGVQNCAVSERWRDNPREALKGLPYVTEKYDERGVYLSTEVSTYSLRRLYTGLDGRDVRVAFESSQQATSYDTTLGAQAASFSAATVVSTELTVPTDLDATPVPSGVPAVVKSVPLRGAAGSATIGSSSTVDAFGNRVKAVANGCQSCSPADEIITSVTRPRLLSNATIASGSAGTGYLGGWLWRTETSSVTGSSSASPSHTIERNKTITQYDGNGAPRVTQATLSGVESLDRFTTQAGGATAGTPATASGNNSTIDVSTLTYDEFGNVILELGPPGTIDGSTNRRCRTVSYESALTSGSSARYAEFPSSESIYTGGCNASGVASGGRDLTTSAVFDRGLGMVTSASDFMTTVSGSPIGGHFTTVVYDAFGRLSELHRPVGSSGDTSTTASTKIDYTLPSPSNPNYSIIHTQTQDGASESTATYLESYSFVDGLGRTRATLSEADPLSDGGNHWIASGIVSYDAKGALQRKYLAQYYTPQSPLGFAFMAPQAVPYGSQRYDAFGRQLQTFDLDGTVTLQSQYHALSTDLYDASDLEPGPHQGTYASTRMDGHGRTVATTERVHAAGASAGAALETHDVLTSYLPTGEPETITRVSSSTSGQVVRWLRYDSLGRMVLNVEPNTTANSSSLFTSGAANLNAATPLPTSTSATSTATPRTWRYVYNNAGDLVGTSDARGCGENFGYDGAGRLVTEDYSPCTSVQRTYTAPNTSTYAGYEVVYVYDSLPSGVPSGSTRPPGYSGTSVNLLGRLAAEFDRAQGSFHTYDARGRLTQLDKQIQKPVATTGASAGAWSFSSYASNWFSKTTSYDAADREVTASTGAARPELLDANGKSAVTTSYTARGTVKDVSSTYKSTAANSDKLVNAIQRTADGLVTSIQYNDAATTTTTNTYDTRRRLDTVETSRIPPSSWSSATNYTPAPTYGSTPPAPPSTFQVTLQFNRYTYDAVNNPTQIDDLRVPEEWPAGAKPVTRKIKYDDLYRATKVDYQYAGGTDAYVSPYAADLSGVNDARRSLPMPHAAVTGRILSQSYAYDWLGNLTSSDDDEHTHFERSLGGPATYTNAGKPYQFTKATHTANGNTYTLTATHDNAGNIVDLLYSRPSASCETGTCQQVEIVTSIDEVGRLEWVQRKDGPSHTVNAQLYYTFDASDERVSSVHIDAAGVATNTEYVFDSLELRRATYDASTSSYRLVDATNPNLLFEVPYLEAHGVRLARVAWDVTAGPAQPVKSDIALNSRLHVFYELGDHLGSTSAVLDKDTGELVELATYQAYGGAETNYRPDRWKGFREEYGFTGKEEDIEVGLTYFGKRFYSPVLGRWMTPDPLAVHAPGKADLNLYAYVRGDTFFLVDPVGLEESSLRIWARGAVNLVRTAAQNAKEHPLQSAATVAKSAIKASLYVNPVGQIVGAYNIVKGVRDMQPLLDKCKAGKCGTAEVKVLERVRNQMAVDVAVGVAGGAIAGGAIRANAGQAAGATESAGAAGSIKRSISGVNPTQELGTQGRTQNCVNCAVATDATLSGSPAAALPSAGPVSIGALEKHYGGKFEAATTLDAIAEQLSAAGDGARGVVFGNRGPGRIGHVFNVVNQEGTVRFLDGQTGKPAETAGQGYTNFRVLRTEKSR